MPLVGRQGGGAHVDGVGLREVVEHPRGQKHFSVIIKLFSKQKKSCRSRI